MIYIFACILLFLLGMVCGAALLSALAFHYEKEEKNGGKKEG